MTHASLFSGIGGSEVAAAALGWQNLFHCEIDDFCCQILEYWFPKSKSYKDVKETDFAEWRGTVDVLTGGFPCQPFSTAGKRRGAEDNRYLWPEFIRVVKEIQPRWVIGENVAGILSMVEPGCFNEMEMQTSLFGKTYNRIFYSKRQLFTVERICRDFESAGYEVQSIIIPACAVGAPHRRDRVFIVARRIASDTNLGADGRAAREDEGTGGEARIQEQHEVRKPDEPNQVRREGERNASADTDSVERSERRCETDGREHDSLQAQVFGIAEGQGRCGNAPHPDSQRGCEVYEHMESELADGAKPVSNGEQRNVAATNGKRLEGGKFCNEEINRKNKKGFEYNDGIDGQRAGWERWAQFPSQPPVCGRNDGLPFDVDDLSISFNQWRTKSLKAYGNAIVPQVIYEIFRAIDMIENGKAC